jgi:hypothetical protein
MVHDYEPGFLDNPNSRWAARFLSLENLGTRPEVGYS